MNPLLPHGRSCLRMLQSALMAALFWSLAMHAQAQQAPSMADPSSTQSLRIATELGLSMAGVALAIGVGAGIGIAANADCDNTFDDLLCGTGGAAGAGMAAGLLAVGLPTLGTALPHYRRGGRGRWWMALTGGLVGLTVGVAGLAVAAAADVGTAGFATTVALGGLVMAGLPVLFIELDHRRRSRDEVAEAPRRVVLGAAPIRRGLSLGLSGRF